MKFRIEDNSEGKADFHCSSKIMLSVGFNIISMSIDLEIHNSQFPNIDEFINICFYIVN